MLPSSDSSTVSVHPTLFAVQDDAPALSGTPIQSGGDGAAGTTGAGGTTTGAPGGFGGGDFVFFFVVMGGLLLFMVVTQVRRDRKRTRMLGEIKKHDRVVTRGGIIGAVVEVKDDSLVLKVDESQNTRITLSRSYIDGVVEQAKS